MRWLRTWRIEQLTLNQRVQGSSPCAPTNKINYLYQKRMLNDPAHAIGVISGVTVRRAVRTLALMLGFEVARSTVSNC
jgi:hypothetical protein